MTLATSIELIGGPGCGIVRSVKLKDMRQTRSGHWCVSLPMPHRKEDPALYSLGRRELSSMSPIQVYDAVFVGWTSDYASPPPPENPPVTEEQPGC